VIGHRRRFMDRAPYAMAAKFFDDVKSAPPHFALDGAPDVFRAIPRPRGVERLPERDRKSTRLNSSHRTISYAVFCLKKKISRLPQHTSPTIVYALDGATGQALWSSGATIPTSGRSGLSAGGSQVYDATADGTLYSFV